MTDLQAAVRRVLEQEDDLDFLAALGPIMADRTLQQIQDRYPVLALELCRRVKLVHERQRDAHAAAAERHARVVKEMEEELLRFNQ